jgi:hypothetical protein
VTDLDALVGRILRSLARHRERYVRAWIAATGMHPTECVLVSWTTADGRHVTSIERRQDHPRPGT